MTKLITTEEENLMHDVIGANHPKPADPEIELLCKFFNRLKSLEDTVKDNPNDASLGEKLRGIDVNDEMSDYR